MNQRARAAACLLSGLLAANLSRFFAVTDRKPRDFTVLWLAARALLHGQDPYQAVPGLLYPLPSVVAATPFAILPSAPLAVAVFMAIGVTAFAWALTEHGWAPLLAVLSAGAWFASEVAQWSPLFAGAAVIAPLGVFLVVKPHVGFPIFAANPTRWPILAGMLCTAIAFACDPLWLPHWRASLVVGGAQLGTPTSTTGYLYSAILFMPGGVLVLAALTRWRRREARLLVALACVPQSLLLYELVPLALIPRGWIESVLFGALSEWVLHLLLAARPWPNVVSYAQASGQLSALLIYLPLTCMILVRPNEGTVPAWMERFVLPWPTWLRGRSLADA